MNAGQLAALIAAGLWAVLVCAAVYVLFRFSRLISAGSRMLTEYRGRADLLIERAQAAVDRTNEQLARTDAITASMDQVTANMAELSGHVSALTGLARGISAGFGTPLVRFASAVYGVRRAVALRRPSRLRAVSAPAASVGPAVPAVPAQREADRMSRPRAIAGSGRRERARR
jgi:hypothetical protein